MLYAPSRRRTRCEHVVPRHQTAVVVSKPPCSTRVCASPLNAIYYLPRIMFLKAPDAPINRPCMMQDIHRAQRTTSNSDSPITPKQAAHTGNYTTFLCGQTGSWHPEQTPRSFQMRKHGQEQPGALKLFPLLGIVYMIFGIVVYFI